MCESQLQKKSQTIEVRLVHETGWNPQTYLRSRLFEPVRSLWQDEQTPFTRTRESVGGRVARSRERGRTSANFVF